MHFLQELVQDYLILAHPQADLPQIEHAEEITHGDKEEISTGKARSCGVSITVLLTAMMLCSIREEIPKNQQKRPVALMIPVNLRNYFPSQSMTNFFGWIEVGYIFSDDRSQSGKQEHYGRFILISALFVCRRSTKNIFSILGFLQVPILCRCVPVLMGMRWYWDLLPRYRMTVSRGISSGCLARRMFPTEN